MKRQEGLKIAGTTDSDTEQAIRGLLEELHAEEAELTVVFFSPQHDVEIVARVLDEATGPRGVGGTTAGELWGQGFGKGTMAGISFSGSGVRATISIITQLRNLSLVPLGHLPQAMARRIGRSPDEMTPDRHLWLSLFDGLSEREEFIAPFFYQAAGNASLAGGSLADGRTFKEVRLVHHGRVFRDAAAMTLLEYPDGFVPFRSTHLEFSEHWFTVTRLGETPRVLKELDGEPAATVLERALELEDAGLSTFGIRPLGHRFRGRPFPCSVVRVLEEGALQLGNSLQVDDRVNLLKPGDLVETTREAISAAAQKLEGPVRGTLLFHCLIRSMEARCNGQMEELYKALSLAPSCGLNTYGEQFAAMHLNHFVTGIHFG